MHVMPFGAIDNLKVQCRSFFDMQKSFLEYLTDRSLIEFIIKVRVKCARKCRFKGERKDMACGNYPLDFCSCIKVRAKWKKVQGRRCNLPSDMSL